MLNTYNTGLDQYITKDQLKAMVPVAFADAPTSDKVSSKYLLVNTETIVDDLEKLGWKPVTAAQRKSRGKGTIFSKHMVSFQNPDIMIKVRTETMLIQESFLLTLTMDLIHSSLELVFID